MRLEIWVLLITSFFIYNAYTDGKYMKMFGAFKKYYKMIFYAAIGFGAYYLLKTNPARGKQMLYYANNMVKALPLNRGSMDILSPIIDMTSTPEQSFMEAFNDIPPQGQVHGPMFDGRRTHKRAVSETKKKYVAANQNWRCGHCENQLDHTYEIDHKVRLEYGGSNDATNLVALCRNCHGRKTANENM